jgi:multimeric flavodoxin WrbA
VLAEFFLPKDMDEFCIGCSNCFSKGEQFCPHYAKVEPIRRAIENADLVIFTTPVYVLRTSGQMKTLLDHFAFQFMAHRPNKAMFSKASLIVSTGAGGGTRPAIKDIATSLKFWGMAKIYRYGEAVYAADWEGVNEKRKAKVEKKVNALSKRIRMGIGNTKPGISTKLLFEAFRLFQIKFGYCEYDVGYWRENGWLAGKRPWTL